MHTHMRETELNKEEEEKLKQCEDALKKWEKELIIPKEQFEKCKKTCYAFYFTQ
jgi:hypothetical protein